MKRFLSVALGLAALVAPLAGCDLTTDQNAPTGPSVQFGASSLTAPEGETTQIPVTLTGATAGQTVTFEVLFAAGASSACGEADDSGDNGGGCLPPPPGEADTTRVDFTGFGTASTNNNRVQTVTLTAGDDGTASTTVDIYVRNEGLVEQAQTAMFAIQNVPAGVRVGTPREISVIIGTLPLGTIHNFPDNVPATVEGVVTRAKGRLTYVQDATGAIAVFSPSGTPLFDAIASGAIVPGDRIQVAGTIDIYNGLTELSFVTGFAVIAEDEGIPEPQTVSLAQLTSDVEAYESELLRITGLTIQTTDVVFSVGTGSGYNYTVVDAAGTTYTLRVVGGADGSAGGTPVPQGPFTFTGVLGQFNTGQLLLTDPSEITQ